ncbi:hypothetical protein DPMN_138598 [Dreissena polymorpha]|uniref:Uncharacterized protein n=1 Tax=Dreissena polymorpha TaxID=45954 RepID=A0A9D4G6Z8_DREPO|nr:hypothetical protein DPMN_134878 [Dreissena polymorpha]KAH3810209.1 hypothetical protein DPMN_138598 [Dreissena polymorpha]
MGGAKSVDLPTCKEIDKEAELGQEVEANHLYDHLEGEKSAGVPLPVPSRQVKLGFYYQDVHHRNSI